MSIKEAYTTQELVAILQVDARTSIARRATRESWQSRPRPGRGGGKEWFVSSMPKATQEALTLAVQRAALALQTGELARYMPADRGAASASTLPAVSATRLLPAVPATSLVMGHVVYNERIDMYDDNRRTRALAKLDMVRVYVDFQSKFGNTVYQKNAFINAYMGGVWPELHRILGDSVSWKSIERWKNHTEREHNALVLVDKRGLHCKGITCISNEHVGIILAFLLHPNAPKVSQCARRIEDVCKAKGLYVPSEATVRRFAKKFFQECVQEFIFFREGKKAWNDKCAMSILRDWTLVGVGDVVIADGHVLNFETINPETGKPKRMMLIFFYDGASNHPLGWEIMPSENTASISAAFRRTCLLLGKIPRVVYIDNGKAFKAKFFKGSPSFDEAGFLGLYADLGCQTITAWPYHGQSKPIERFFGTLHDMEVFVPSYTGNCIAAKPPRMMRGEHEHIAMYEATSRPLTLDETHTLLAEWIEKYTHTPQRTTHLRGRSPAEVFEAGRGPGVDAERLRLMMLQKVVKTVSKDGIRLNGKLFYSETLANIRQSVLVRYDDHFAPHTCLVYRMDGTFICEAFDRAHFGIAHGVHPAAYALGTPEQQKQLVKAIELKKGQEKDAKHTFKETLIY